MKIKISLVFSVILLFSASVFAQTYVTQFKPADSKTWGYVNNKGEVLIKPQYEKCHKFFKEGLAPVYDPKAKQFFFINLKNEKLATEAKDFKLIDRFGFDLDGFGDGLIPIKQGDKFGYLNADGKVAIPAKYDHVTVFNSGHGVGKLGKNFVVLNTKGEESPVEAGALDVKEFTENLAPYRASDKKYGFVDTNGKVVIKAQFESVGYFSEGLAWVKSDDDKVGYINPQGELVIKPQFAAGKDFDASTGLARVRVGETWGYTDKKGDVTYVKDTDQWGDFSDGLAEGRKNGLTGFFNSKGEWAIEPKFNGARAFKNGFAAVKQGDKWGVIDNKGNWVINPSYERVMDMELVN
jgi:hypothetical protein